MAKYKVSYNGKEYRYNGNNTGEIFDKFKNRKVFGAPLFFSASLKMYDADTRGEVWAQYKAGNNFIMIEKL